MSAAAFQLTVQPTLSAVARASEALQAALPARLRGADRDAVAIALAEVLTNIVEHGYADVAPAPIDVRWNEAGATWSVEVRDAGRPIPPQCLDAAGPDTFAFDPDDVPALPEGGLGLAILKSAFDRVDYGQEGSLNCLRLEKQLA